MLKSLSETWGWQELSKREARNEERCHGASFKSSGKATRLGVEAEVKVEEWSKRSWHTRNDAGGHCSCQGGQAMRWRS
jgi:hypothetical protein